jgi:hypothetical protein
MAALCAVVAPAHRAAAQRADCGWNELSCDDVAKHRDNMQGLTMNEDINYCSGINPDLQCEEINARAFFQSSQCGFCHRCISFNPLDRLDTWTTVTNDVEGFLSAEDIPGTTPREWTCTEIQDRNCLNDPDGLLTRIDPQCSFDRDNEANHTLDPNWTPPPAPGPNGEQRCNSDCRSPENYWECVGGFRICHKYSTCSDGALLICEPGPCEGIIFC